MGRKKATRNPGYSAVSRALSGVGRTRPSHPRRERLQCLSRIVRGIGVRVEFQRPLQQFDRARIVAFDALARLIGTPEREAAFGLAQFACPVEQFERTLAVPANAASIVHQHRQIAARRRFVGPAALLEQRHSASIIARHAKAVAMQDAEIIARVLVAGLAGALEESCRPALVGRDALPERIGCAKVRTAVRAAQTRRLV